MTNGSHPHRRAPLAQRQDHATSSTSVKGATPPGAENDADDALIVKWSRTGLLKGVQAAQLHRCARRLERALGTRLRWQDLEALDRELASMDREGLFGR